MFFSLNKDNFVHKIVLQTLKSTSSILNLRFFKLPFLSFKAYLTEAQCKTEVTIETKEI